MIVHAIRCKEGSFGNAMSRILKQISDTAAFTTAHDGKRFKETSCQLRQDLMVSSSKKFADILNDRGCKEFLRKNPVSPEIDVFPMERQSYVAQVMEWYHEQHVDASHAAKIMENPYFYVTVKLKKDLGLQLHEPNAAAGGGALGDAAQLVSNVSLKPPVV